MVGDVPIVSAAEARIDVRTTDRFQVEETVAAAFDAYAPALKGFATAVVRDPDAAEDLVQEAFLRLIRELQAGRRLDNTRAWLFSVCTNLAISQARRRSVRDRLRFRLIERGTGATSSSSETISRAISISSPTIAGSGSTTTATTGACSGSARIDRSTDDGG